MSQAAFRSQAFQALQALAWAAARLAGAGLVFQILGAVSAPAADIPIYLLRLMMVSEAVRAAAAISLCMVALAIAATRMRPNPVTFSEEATT